MRKRHWKRTASHSRIFLFGWRLTERNRYLELSDIRLPESVHTNNLIDIRISFPTGEDYIVLNQQRVLSLLNEDEGTSVCGIALNLSEEDLLRLSSARVDENLFEGTYLYAVIYQADFENAAVTTYPVNPQVFTLMQWDPNIVSLFTVKEQEKTFCIREPSAIIYPEGNGEFYRSWAGISSGQPRGIARTG